MKKQLPRSRPKPKSIPTHHQFDHEVPTVVHDPEEKMTALGRFTYHVIKEPRKYVSWAIWVTAGVVAVAAAWSIVTRGRTVSSDVWAKLDVANKPEDRVELAKEYPNSEASTWVLLQAATEYYNLALADLPNNRDVALPLFLKAINLFEQVVSAAPKDSPQAREAALGKARALESRYELPKAIDQYELVVKTWPGTAEAEQAKQFLEFLKTPEATSFYKELHAYSPSKVTLPPLGSEKIPFAPTGGAAPSGPVGIPFDTKYLPDMPVEAAPTTIREIKAETPKPATPNLPADVFSPAPKPPK
jgi:tetratricopeptide (TPR) repeat protein